MDKRISNFMQVASVRRYTYNQGKETGVSVIDCDNGKIRFLLNVTKGLDVIQLWHEGQNVSFVSKNGCSASELPFAHRFEGGMLYTCGLDNVGEHDGYDLHGSYHNKPADVTKCECNEGGITVEAEIANTALFGRNLVLKRKIYTAIGSDTVEINDTLENRAYRDEKYCMIYHVNLGYPMLDDCGEIECGVEKMSYRTEWAKEHNATHKQMTAPVDNQFEMCYYLYMKEPKITYKNPRIGKSFTLCWSQDTLPCFIEWKSMASGDYALGLEPCTTELDENFKYSTIKAQSSISNKLSIKISKI